ncbi:MAG: sigma-70 family RNA polymerase sigma factor [Deltaproteobacteria bacterium]|nr:sigma-70 family RNA polymerase sigma factor [Deltaproteobacteria bacterium]
MTEKEKALLAGCVNGDKAAWDAFVVQYSALVYHTIRKTLTLHHASPQDDIVEDLHQNFFLSICENDFRKLRQFKGDRGCSLASWLRMIASRVTVDFLRLKQPPTVEVPVALASDQPDPPNTLVDREEERQIAKALDGLSPRDRLFVDLHFYRGLPPEEVATILNVSVAAVYTLKSRLMDKLREVLKKA